LSEAWNCKTIKQGQSDSIDVDFLPSRLIQARANPEMAAVPHSGGRAPNQGAPAIGAIHVALHATLPLPSTDSIQSDAENKSWCGLRVDFNNQVPHRKMFENLFFRPVGENELVVYSSHRSLTAVSIPAAEADIRTPARAKCSQANATDQDSFCAASARRPDPSS
jgi:hypothetical protein